jgi:RNA polymerase sigma-70 factor (ECF subfamily)
MSVKQVERRAKHTTTVDELRSIYRATLPAVFGYLMMHVGGNRELAEDLTAETYLHATRHVHRGRAEEVTVPWLKTVARRRLVDHWRHEGSLNRRTERLGDELALQRDLDLAESALDRQEIHGALAALGPDQRLVLVLKHLDGLSVKEIADQIGRSEDATSSLLSRSRSAFRSAFGGGGRDA